ncbi:unnamed protein product [Nippostrongylus brasiliensis]|uniref:GGDEF domain-containing protein n=1 Tax=Nippostrongylus brasiliensis TaxID=27835 RepID=A0A0N4XRT0_NIPBR|nr:unnamed protein product [Nippostrongylus brasiliensis]
MTGSLVLLIRGLLALFYQQQGNDPQTFYQNCRCFFVALAGLFAFLFRHPALLQITQIQCMFSSFVMTCSFLFGELHRRFSLKTNLLEFLLEH